MLAAGNAEASPPATAPKSSPTNASSKVDEYKTKKPTPKTRSMSSKATSGSASPARGANSNPRSLTKISPEKKSHLSTKKTARAILHTKSPEEMLGEILELKKALSVANDDNSALKTKLRRLEDENNRKEKQIYQLHMGVAKTESQKHSTNSAVNNFKRRIQKLEMSLKERETLIKKMQSDARASKQESLKRAPESPNENVAKRSQGSTRDSGRRLQVLHGSPTARGCGSLGSSSNRGQNVVTSEHIDQLKTWLRRALSLNEDFQKKYESMNNMELIAEINRLMEEIEINNTMYEEIKKLRQLDGTSSAVVTDWREKEVVLRGDVENLTEEVKSLKVDRSAFYEMIEKKDSELTRLQQELEKVRKEYAETKPKYSGGQSGVRRSINSSANAKTPLQRATASTTTPPSSHTHSRAREVSPKQAVTASKVNGRSVTTTTTTKVMTRKSRTPVTTGKVPQAKPVAEMPTDNCLLQGSTEADRKDAAEGQKTSSAAGSSEVEHFRQNLAAKKIQKTWKKHHEEKPQTAPVNWEVSVADKEARLRAIKENHAAIVLQKGWKASVQKSDNERDVDEAVVIIQSAARGHSERSQHLASLQDVSDNMDQKNEEESRGKSPTLEDSLNTSATIIQAAARGHYAREEMLCKWEGTNGTEMILQDESSVP